MVERAALDFVDGAHAPVWDKSGLLAVLNSTVERQKRMFSLADL
jgi:hypothetical protein